MRVMLFLFLGSCGSSESPFEPGLDRLEPNIAPAPEGDGWPEDEVSIVTGEGEDYLWGHARSYICAPAGEVWQVLKNPLLVADRRATDEQTWDLGTEPEYEYSFVLHYEVQELISVEWDEAWRYGVLEGSSADPSLALIRYQKTEGSDLIELLEGSVELHPAAAAVTEVQQIEHIDATGADEDAISQYFQDFHYSLLAGVDGEPLPDW